MPVRRLVVAALLAAALAARPAAAQDGDPLTAAYPDSLCSNCAAWSVPQAPFRLHGDTYFVGTGGLGAILITSPDGHVLIDGALPNSAPRILAGVRALGFDPADVALLLNSHAHFDHAGGLAALQRATGARVAASPASAAVLERGRSGPDDPQYGMLLGYPAVPRVERFTPGDTLRVGRLAVASHATGGHAPGGTSWSWTSCDAEGCVNVVYGDSQTPVSADGYRFAAHPAMLEAFERGFRTLETLPCDILVTTHVNAAALQARAAEGLDALVDPQACVRYAAAARERLAERLAREADGRD